MTYASEPAEDTPPWKDEWRDWADCFTALLQGDLVAEQAMKWIEAQPGYDRKRPMP